MNEIKDLLAVKRNLIAAIVILILLVALPAGLYLSKNQQIFKPRASFISAYFAVVPPQSVNLGSPPQTYRAEASGTNLTGMEVFFAKLSDVNTNPANGAIWTRIGGSASACGTYGAGLCDINFNWPQSGLPAGGYYISINAYSADGNCTGSPYIPNGGNGWTSCGIESHLVSTITTSSTGGAITASFLTVPPQSVAQGSSTQTYRAEAYGANLTGMEVFFAKLSDVNTNPANGAIWTRIGGSASACSALGYSACDVNYSWPPPDLPAGDYFISLNAYAVDNNCTGSPYIPNGGNGWASCGPNSHLTTTITSGTSGNCTTGTTYCWVQGGCNQSGGNNWCSTHSTQGSTCDPHNAGIFNDGCIASGGSGTCTPACGAGYTCNNGTCVPSGGSICNPACTAGYTCNNGSCIPGSGSVCTPACGSGYICSAGQCIPSSGSQSFDLGFVNNTFNSTPNPITVGSPVSFDIPAIKNNGSAVSAATTVDLAIYPVVNGTLDASHPVAVKNMPLNNILQPGATLSPNIHWDTGWTAVAGSYAVGASIDSAHDIADSNWSNNISSSQFTVQAATSSTYCPVLGDVTGAADGGCDGQVTLVDFNWWLDEYMGRRTTKRANFNPSQDDKVSLVDFNIWLTEYKNHGH